MKFALISVSNKTDVNKMATFLLQHDYTILSTGGTYSHLIKQFDKKRIISIENYTDYPEILQGRVKTLHPKIYGGILYDSKLTQDDLIQLDIIDVVIVNLYPFKDTVKNCNATEDDIIENIDIGGVSLIRAAAKNYKNCLVVCNPSDYDYVIDNFNNNDLRKKMAIKGFKHVTDYDMSISQYFDKSVHYRTYNNLYPIKYGCNPYQDNAFISTIDTNKLPIKIMNGEPGYINCLDALNSWLLVCEASQSLNVVACASFKHTAPAGVAIAQKITPLEKQIYDLTMYDTELFSDCCNAFVRARNCDPLSSFGDFIAISDVVDEDCARLIKREVSDGIIAKGYTKEALSILKTKKKGKYIVLIGDTDFNEERIEYREIMGLCLSQKCNNIKIGKDDVQIMPTKNNTIPDCAKNDLILSTITLKYTPSNSITIGCNGQVIGIGAGQQNRVDCIKLSGNKANLFILKFHEKSLQLLSLFKPIIKRQDKINAVIKYINNDFTDSELNHWYSLFISKPSMLTNNEKELFLANNKKQLVLSSDAFFPFRDNIDYANKFNIKYILNPGGSIQDKDIIAACDEYNICMAISNKRLFLH